jgi:hypothetical protein
MPLCPHALGEKWCKVQVGREHLLREDVELSIAVSLVFGDLFLSLGLRLLQPSDFLCDGARKKR